MTYRRLAAFFAAASLSAAPVAAQSVPQPAPEQAEGSEMRAVLVLPALAILIPILLVLLLTRGGDEPPISP
jgi:hypothetical protein